MCTHGLPPQLSGFEALIKRANQRVMNSEDNEPDVVKQNNFLNGGYTLLATHRKKVRIVTCPLNIRGSPTKNWPEVAPLRVSRKDKRDERQKHRRAGPRGKETRGLGVRRKGKHARKFDSTCGYPGEGPVQITGYSGPTDCMLAAQCYRATHSHWTAKPLTGKRRREREKREGKIPSRNKPTLCQYTLDLCPDRECHFHPEDNEEEWEEDHEHQNESTCEEEDEDFKHESVTAPTRECEKAKASPSSSNSDFRVRAPSVSTSSCVRSVSPPPSPVLPVVKAPKSIETTKEPAYSAETEMVNLYLGNPIGKRKGLFRIPKLSEILPDLLFRTTTVVNKNAQEEEMMVSDFHSKTWVWKSKNHAKQRQHTQQLLADSYESVTVVEVFTQLAKLLYEDKHLCSRVAVGKDGAVHKDFLGAIRHIATTEKKYNFFREQNYEIYENTLRYTFNRYILRGLTDSLLVPVGGVAKRPDFRLTGRFRRTPRIDQCFV